MPYAPTLTPQPTMSPVPRTEAVFNSVPAAAARATVYRVAGGRTFRVRGGINVPAAGGFGIVDTEMPFWLPSTIRAEFFDNSGVSLGFGDGATTTLQFDGTVVHQPLDPERAVLVDVEAGTTSSLRRSSPGETVRPLLRDVAVWVGFGGRGGVEGVPLRFTVGTDEAAAAFESIFGGYGDTQIPIACIRSSLDLNLPQPFFARMDPDRIPFNQRSGGTRTRWSASADEVAPPLEMVLTALLSYGDLEATYATYSALESAYLTYLAMETDYSLAGTV